MQVTKPYMLCEARKKSKARTKRTASIRPMRQRTRLKTLTLPATAPTRESWSMGAMTWRTVSGLMMLSESMVTKNSPVPWVKPA